MIGMIGDGSIEARKIWFCDEAHFWLTGHVNKQNHRFWGSENPRIFETTSLKPQRTTVWCALSGVGIVGPVFLDQNVNGERYRQMLEDEFIPVIQGAKRIDRYWFMQDGAAPPRTEAVFNLIDEHFDGRVLGLGYTSRFNRGLDWPARSPDLNARDFFLWGYLKDRVYRSSPRSINELKAAIAINREILAKVGKDWQTRLYSVVEHEGGHIEPFLH